MALYSIDKIDEYPYLLPLADEREDMWYVW
jgi:hypothetical protein